MQYWELVLLSFSVICIIAIPYFVTISLLRELRIRWFQCLSLKECILLGIVLGELSIIIPAFLLGIFSISNISIVFYTITILNASIPIILFIKLLKGNRVNQPNLLLLCYNKIKSPPYIFLCLLLVFYGYLITITPVDLSFDAINYFLPHAKGLLERGLIPTSPLESYVYFGGQPSQPPGIPLLYAYSLNMMGNIDAFKLLPLLFLSHIVLVSSMIGKSIFPSIRWIWIPIIILVTPPIFIYVVSTPYNADLLFYSIYLSTIYYILRAKQDKNILWSAMAGACISGTILTRDIGIIYTLPAISLIILGTGRFRWFWTLPLVAMITFPISFLTNSTLSKVYFVHATALISIQLSIIIVLYALSRKVRFNHSVRKLPFLVMIVPGLVFVVWSFIIWGSPIIRTQIGLLNSYTTIDYQWATALAFKQLGTGALPILPQTFEGMYLNLAYLFVAPALGSLFLIPKLVSIRPLLRNHCRLPLIIVLLVIFTWLTIFGGLYYNDGSTFRHTLDIVAILSILATIGYHYIFSKTSTKSADALFLVSVSFIFFVEMVTYVDYDSNILSIISRVLLNEPFLRFAIISIALFVTIYVVGATESFRRTKIYGPLTVVSLILLLVSMIPILNSTNQVMSSHGYSYEKTYEYALSHLTWYPKILDVIKFFKSQAADGNILAYGVDSLDYRSGWNVLEMRAIIDMAILKNVLQEKDPSTLSQKLKSYNVSYIIIPIGGFAGKRYSALYSSTEFAEFLKTPFVQPIKIYSNLVIFKLK